MTDGYVSDVPYVWTYNPELAPAWLDHAALVAGFVPPDRGDSFTWCDLGCGLAFTAIALAATHSRGRFYGIDVLPAHIEAAGRLANDAALQNLTLHCADFETAADLRLPPFDYIVSHGVYSWVSAATRRSWLRFVDRHLKPGGLVFVSYNAMPGRAADLPLQRLVRSLGNTLPGDSQTRAVAALGVARAMTELKAPALTASPMVANLLARADIPPGYLAHELMNANWEPLCVTDVRADTRSVGLEPAGTANLLQNYDSFVLRKAARDVLAGIEDPDAREFARDFFLDQVFRQDVFIRAGRFAAPDQRRAALLARSYALAVPLDKVEYIAQTPAGKLRFDNAPARHIVAELAAGPRVLSELEAPGLPLQDLLANALVLCAAGVILPVESTVADVSAINAAIQRRDGAVRYRVLPRGTAIRS